MQPEREAAPPAPAAADGADGDNGLICQLEVKLEMSHVTAVRRFIAELAYSVVPDMDLATRLALAAHELLENAVKYSLASSDRVTVRLSALPQRSLRVTVLNRSSEALATPLYGLFSQLNGAPDRAANYHQMIDRSLERDTGSGLGLARISAEGGMTLSCELRRGVLAVTAEARIGDRP